MLHMATHLERDTGRGGSTLEIVVFNPGSMGGTPTVGVQGFHSGIDWNNGQVLITPHRPLTVLTAEDVKAIHTSALSGQSWHAYQAQKRLRARILELESELSTLKAAP